MAEKCNMSILDLGWPNYYVVLNTCELDNVEDKVSKDVNFLYTPASKS